MNSISKCARVCSSLKIGSNNKIGENVKIYNNVVIGNNNKIFNGVTLYPNTIIGNNNLILNGNVIGEHPINHYDNVSDFQEKNHDNGVIIGNNNYFHVNNIIFAGCEYSTRIGNNNKILAENHIGHDTIIQDNVSLYARCITGGYSKIMSNSSMGIYATIQQRKKLGNYSMIAAGNHASKDVFPFYIQVNNQYIRFNEKKIPDSFDVHTYENEIRILAERYKKLPTNDIVYGINLPKNIYETINNFIFA